MKKSLKIILAIIISFISICSIKLGAETSAPSAYAENTSIEAKLLYNPNLITASSTEMFVYDEYASTIKVYNISTKALNENKHIVLNNVLKIEACGNFLFVLSNNDITRINVYDVSSFAFISSVTSENKSILSSCFNFAVYSYSESNIYLMAGAFDNTLIVNKFYIFNFEINLDPTLSSFANTVAEFETNITTQTKISSLKLAPNTTNGYLTLVLSMASKVYYFNFKPAEQAEFQQATNEITLNLTENVLSLNRISEDDKNYLIVSTPSGFYLYEENILGGYTLNFISKTNTTLLTSYGFGDNNYNLFIASPSTKQIFKFSLNNTTPKTLSGETQVENGTMQISAISASNLQFFKVNNSQAILTGSPFSKEPLKKLSLDENIVRVAKVMFGESELIEYYYCMLTTPSGNIYGYVKSSYLTEIEPVINAKTTILINSDSNIYSLPSIFTDTASDIKNTKTTISEITEAAVLSSGVYNYNSISSFYLVKTKDNQIGFVETDREFTASGAKKLIKNNASTIKETIVYDSPEDNAEIIDTLKQGKRVKVEDSQKTNAKFVKITYNDDSGVERTGYVLSENLKTDAWSVLQIIGLVLVALNVIFLVVLLFVKKRLNHD
ncbi:MAG: SH3 domain-containing protein [Clostridia bacterium]|nr:SH3 domain-containing protein [Clostridia bacterium]